MSTEAKPAAGPKILFWAGWVLTGLSALGLVASGAMKLTVPAEVPDDLAKNLAHIGWDPKLLLALGIIELVCTAIYVFPKTATLGAILLTGYLGGAVATHVRVGDPWFAPVILGVLVWLGLYLRDARLRAIVPLR